MDYEDQLELIKDYIEDANEFLDRFDELLLKLEANLGSNLDHDLVAAILGALHTFKGNSGMMGFTNIQKYAHKLEDVFKALESTALDLEPALIDVVMQSASSIRAAVGDIDLENIEDPDLSAEIGGLDSFLKDHVEIDAPAAANSAQLVKEGANPFAYKTNVLKVDFQRLDQLLNLMGELVIYRTRLGQIESRFLEAFGDRGISTDLSDTAEQIGKVTTELHEAIMRVRMLPIKQVFMRFPRLVRDLAHERNKQIDLVFEGEETELDKTVIDEIGEPLLHLIRNAIDHGIEGASERRDLGKDPAGKILIRAYQESSHIIIEVEDDGRGIDEDKVRAKAREFGLSVSDDLGRQEVLDYIFMSGMSTADAVTEVSGRGVGMDVVRKSLNKINGIIEVQTEPGQGTRFTIKLPLTLAIISALMVRVGDEQYAIPLTSVVESLRIEGDEIHEVNNREVTKIRERILPLARVSDLFGISENGNRHSSKYVVIVQSTLGQIGFVVDTLIGQQEIVIKALDDYLGNSVGIAGATILGDGKVVLIMDVLALMENARSSSEGSANIEVGHA